MNFFRRIIFPAAAVAAGLLPKRSRTRLLRRLIAANNRAAARAVVAQRKNDSAPVRVLVLLPRCIQWFDCPNNLVASVDNCTRCGRCVMPRLLDLSRRYPVTMRLAPGGSLAKLFVRQARPDVILAVACENELALGIREVHPIPVVAVLNDIPGSPCVNTTVAVDAVGRTLQDLFPGR